MLFRSANRDIFIRKFLLKESKHGIRKEYIHTIKMTYTSTLTHCDVCYAIRPCFLCWNWKYKTDFLAKDLHEVGHMFYNKRTNKQQPLFTLERNITFDNN